MPHHESGTARRRSRRSAMTAFIIAAALALPLCGPPAMAEPPHSTTVRRRNTDCQLLLTEKRLLGWDVSGPAGTVKEARKIGQAGDLAGALALLEQAETELRSLRSWRGNPQIPRVIATAPPGSKPEFDELATLEAGSLRLGFDNTGRLVGVRAGSRDLGSWLAGGFHAQNAVTGETSGFTGRVTELDNGIGLSGTFPGLDARLEARFRSAGDRVEVEGTLTDTSKHDRGMVLCFKIPFDGAGFSWWDDADLAMEIPHQPCILQNSAPLSSATQARRLASIYPLGCISDPGAGLVLATAIDHPAVFRINYDNEDKSLNLYYDFGLTGKTAKFPGEARFRFVIYPLAEPEWGFRSALDSYYGIYPEAFAGRVEEAGLWGTVEAAAKLGEEYKRMGFVFLQGENDAPTWGKRLGLWSLRYCRPWCFFAPGPATPVSGGLARLTADPGALNLQPSHRLIFGKVTAGQLLRGVELSAIHDVNGKSVSAADRVRGGVNYVLNADPEIAGLPGERNAARLTIEEAIVPAARNYKSQGQTRWGLFMDVAGTLLRYENFRQDHMAVADYPLTFAEDGKEPVILGLSSACEYLAHVRSWAAAEGGMVGVNTSPHPYNLVFLSPFCDMAGTEHLPGRREMNNRRALAHQRPVGFRTVESWEELLRHGLFYGVFPSRVPPGQVRTSLAHLDQAKPLLNHLVPLIQTVSAAGWEPVTHARTNAPNLLVERFGRFDAGPVYYSVWNRTGSEREVALQLDDTARGWVGENPQVVELAGHRKVNFAKSSVSLTLGTDEVAVIRFEAAGK